MINCHRIQLWVPTYSVHPVGCGDGVVAVAVVALAAVVGACCGDDDDGVAVVVALAAVDEGVASHTRTDHHTSRHNPVAYPLAHKMNYWRLEATPAAG